MHPKLMEEYFTLTLSTILCVWGWVTLVSMAPQPVFEPDLERYLVGYPHPFSTTERYYLIAEGSYYLFMLLRPFLAVGLDDRPAMKAHHVISFTMLCGCTALSFHRIGILALTLLSSSNPLLHLSRILNVKELPTLRVLAFLLFTVVWTATRIVAYPATVLAIVFEHVQGAAGKDLRRYFRHAALCKGSRPLDRLVARNFDACHRWFTTGLVLLYALQLYWTYQILVVLIKLKDKGGAEAGRAARQHYEQVPAGPPAETTMATIPEEVEEEDVTPISASAKKVV